MTKLKWGLIGGGEGSQIGPAHRLGALADGLFEFSAAALDHRPDVGKNFAKSLGINENRAYGDWHEMLTSETKRDDRIDLVTVATPNSTHFEITKAFLEAGFNVLCEKPMTTTYAEAKDLENIYKSKNLTFAVTYTYTGYPMIRQMKEMIKSGVIGDIQRVDLQYYQGWINPIIHDSSKRSETWRLQPEKSGISCCIGDIGTHAFDMLEYVTGMEVKELLSDLNYVYDDNTMDVDGTILIRFSDKIKGVIRASQIATGEENNFTVAIYGKKGGLKWEQQNPNYLYHLSETDPMKVLKPGHDYNSNFAKISAKLPPGHPEGMFDSMANIYFGVAREINGNKEFDGEYPTLNDGLRGMLFIEKAVESHKSGNTWVKLN